MPSLLPFSFGAYVVGAAALAGRPAFALGDGRVAVLDGATPRFAAAHRGGLLAATASLDGRTLLTGGDDGRLVATDAEGGTTELAAKPRKWLDVVAAGPQGAIGFASGRDAWVRLADGSERAFPHEKAVTGLAFLPKGLRLATATTNKARLLWVTTEGKPVDLDWKGAHLSVTVAPDGRFVLTTLQEPGLHGWRLEDGKHLRMSGYPAKVRSTSWSPRGRWLATSGANAAIVWPFTGKDGPMGKAPLELGLHRALVARVAFHPSEEVLAAGYEDGMIMAIRLADNAEVVIRPAPEAAAPITALAWDATGRRVLFGTENGDAGVIDLGG